MHNGGLTQLLAVLALTAAVFVGGSLATEHVTWTQLTADPAGTLWRTVEPTVDSLWP